MIINLIHLISNCLFFGDFKVQLFLFIVIVFLGSLIIPTFQQVLIFQFLIIQLAFSLKLILLILDQVTLLIAYYIPGFMNRQDFNT